MAARRSFAAGRGPTRFAGSLSPARCAARPKQPPRDIYVSCNVLRGISPDREPILNKRSRIVRGASRSSDVVKHRLTVLEQTSGSEQMCRDEDVVRISISSLDFTGAVAVICVQSKKTHESFSSRSALRRLDRHFEFYEWPRESVQDVACNHSLRNFRLRSRKKRSSVCLIKKE